MVRDASFCWELEEGVAEGSLEVRFDRKDILVTVGKGRETGVCWMW